MSNKQQNQENSKPSIRLRIAPSPTGYPHIGTIYQALFNFAFAHKHEGRFIVRIEDTDRARFVEGAEDVIFSSLDWFGLSEDESPRKDGGFGPYRQSERLELYHKYTEELIAKGHAFYSYFPKKDAGQKKDYSSGREEKQVTRSEKDTPSSIADMIAKGDWVVRMRVPKEGSVTFRDEIRGGISFPVSEVTEQVLIKSDGFPTYHLAVVVDDHLMQITHIVRGEEWISSTPKHILLYTYFGWDAPLIYHTPDLRNPDKSKLSKRQGHTNVNWYKEEGYLPEALLNFLALQGWSHPEEKEIFSLLEFVQLFDLKDIKPVGPIFDLTKLTWMNQQYIMQLSLDGLKNRLQEFYHKDPEVASVLTADAISKLLPLAQTRMKTLKDFRDLVIPETIDYSEEEKQFASEFLAFLKRIEPWQKDTILEQLKEFISQKGAKWQQLYMLLTGRKQGLPLADTMELSGKEAILTKLERIV